MMEPEPQAETIVINNLEFRLTCFACPEQYDVFSGSRQVGYVRLRGGFLSGDFPPCGGETVLEHIFDDDWKGCFDNDEERHYWLNRASVALLNRLKGVTPTIA